MDRKEEITTTAWRIPRKLLRKPRERALKVSALLSIDWSRLSKANVPQWSLQDYRRDE